MYVFLNVLLVCLAMAEEKMEKPTSSFPEISFHYLPPLPHEPLAKLPNLPKIPKLPVPQLPPLMHIPYLGQLNLFKKKTVTSTMTVYAEVTKTVTRHPVCVTAHAYKAPCLKEHGRENDFEENVLKNQIQPTKTPLFYPATRVASDIAESEEVWDGSMSREGRYVVQHPIPVAIADTKLSPKIEDMDAGKIVEGLFQATQHVFETVYLTKVEKVIDHGTTATLLVDNCFPTDPKMPLCGPIPAHHKEEVYEVASGGKLKQNEESKNHEPQVTEEPVEKDDKKREQEKSPKVEDSSQDVLVKAENAKVASSKAGQPSAEKNENVAQELSKKEPPTTDGNRKVAEETPKKEQAKTAEELLKVEQAKMADELSKIEPTKGVKELPKVSEGLSKEERPKAAELTKVSEEKPKEVPKVAEEAAKVELKVAEESPKVEEESPKIAEELRKVAEEWPKVAEESSKVEEESPKTAEELPKVAEEWPKVAEELPKVAEESTKVEPKVTEESPKVAEESPKFGEESPKTGLAEESPQVFEDSPEPENADDLLRSELPNADQTENTEYSDGEELPKFAQETPKSEEPELEESSKVDQSNVGETPKSTEDPKITFENDEFVKAAAPEESKADEELPNAIEEKPKSNLPQITDILSQVHDAVSNAEMDLQNDQDKIVFRNIAEDHSS